ncbi:hypothetical protein [Gordonia aurantiaca]|uniref:hypothetical protein n=1 Tax=Gordonia sp. B21 TaxID=3151852 RepID=UPI0032656EE0
MASPRIASDPVGPTSVASTTAVSSNTTEMSPARVHVWRVLSMLAALIGVIVALVVIASSAV